MSISVTFLLLWVSRDDKFKGSLSGEAMGLAIILVAKITIFCISIAENKSKAEESSLFLLIASPSTPSPESSIIYLVLLFTIYNTSNLKIAFCSPSLCHELSHFH